MALLIAYGLGCAAAALPAGISGNNQAWHRFVDADPRIVSAEASIVLDVDQGYRGGPDTVFLSGFAEFGGSRYAFENAPVRFHDWDGAADLVDADLWAVFDPEDLDAGFVVAESRSEAESVLEFPIPPLLSFGLAIAGCCWAVQRLRLRASRFPDRVRRPIDEAPVWLWVLFTIPCALWLAGVTTISVVAGDDAPLRADPVNADILVFVWMVLLAPGIGCFPAFFHSSAANRVPAM